MISDMTISDMARLLAAVVFAFGMLASGNLFAPAASADPAQDIENRIDHYFGEPRSPETFRALSGMGLPAGAKPADTESFSHWWSADADEKDLLKSLFPSLDMSQAYWYPDFGDCRPEAPLQQLKERRALLGADHPYVAQWLRVERAVLSVCGRNRDKVAAVTLPPLLDVADPAVALLQKQDRAYQQAALRFYQEDFAAALALFQVIAADRASPNRPLAAYMVLAIQAGSGIRGQFFDLAHDRAVAMDSAVLPPDQSLKAIQAVLADPSLQSIHGMAASLIGWIGATVADRPTRTAQVREAIAALMMPTDRLAHEPQLFKRYEAALSDIDFLHNRFPKNPDWVVTDLVPAGNPASEALAELAKREPMAAWVAFPTNAYHERAWVLAAATPESPAVRAYLDRMGANGAESGNPWVHENPDTSASMLSVMVDDEIARLKVNTADEQAAAGLSLDAYNLIRRLLMDKDDRNGNFKAALQRLQAFPYKTTDMFGRMVDDSLQYLISVGRLAEARRLRDALKLDQPEGRTSLMSGATGPLLVLAEDEDHLVRALAVAGDSYPREYLNHLSAAELWRLSARDELSRGERALFVRAAWSREYAMGRAISRPHDHLLRILAPEITATWQAPSGREVKPGDIAVARDVLKSPGLNTVIEDFSRMPDDKNNQATAALTGLDHYNHNDNNWWCGWDVVRHDAALDATLADSFRLYDDKPEVERDDVRQMLTSAVQGSFLFRNIDAAELTDLSKVKCAPELLSEQVIAWVRKSGVAGSRNGQAEALADAVLSTRWGCNRQGGHLAYSRAAFALLHTLFPDTEAAKRTTYWFD